MNRISFLLVLSLSITSCVTQQQSLTVVKGWPHPQVQFDSNISLSLIDHVLEKTGNSRGERWAERKNLHVVSVKLVNNSNNPIHGTQVSLLINDKKAEVISNKWLAKKIRLRASPLSFLFIPTVLIEETIYDRIFNKEDEYGIDENTYDMEFHTISERVAEEYSNERKKSNSNLKTELASMELARKTLWPNQPVYCIVGIKTEDDISKMKALISESNFTIIK